MVEFTVTESQDLQVRTVVNGVAVTVKTAVFAATPASVTRAELEEHVRHHAKQDENGEWTFDSHPLFSYLMAEDFEDLMSDAANELNGCGISVSDWPPYCITEG